VCFLRCGMQAIVLVLMNLILLQVLGYRIFVFPHGC
jgi:hypothetical protein